jgi:hypothetical protein
LGAVKARAKELNDIGSKNIGSQLMMNARISQQYADSFKKTVAIPSDTLPLQLVMLTNSFSEPRVSCLEIGGEENSMKAALRQVFYGVLHEEKSNQEKTGK